MTWGAVGAAAIGVVGGAMASGSGGGASSTQTKDPWSAAVPWLTSNLGIGQNLQNYYQANPFNSVQQASYGNLLGGNDYINQLMPSLLSQVSQPQGFNPANPRAQPAAFNFMAAPMPRMAPTAGLLGGGMGGGMNQTFNPFANGGVPAQPPTAQAPAGVPYVYQPPFDNTGGGGGG